MGKCIAIFLNSICLAYVLIGCNIAVLEPSMPDNLPKVYPENDELNKPFVDAEPLPDICWETDNKTDLPKEGADVSIPSGRLAFSFLPTRPYEAKSIFIDKTKLEQIISEFSETHIITSTIPSQLLIIAMTYCLLLIIVIIRSLAFVHIPIYRSNNST